MRTSDATERARGLMVGIAAAISSESSRRDHRSVGNRVERITGRQRGSDALRAHREPRSEVVIDKEDGLRLP